MKDKCPKLCLTQTFITLIGLAVLSWWAFQEPLIPDEDDCRAQMRASDCWRER